MKLIRRVSARAGISLCPGGVPCEPLRAVQSIARRRRQWGGQRGQSPWAPESGVDRTELQAKYLFLK